MSLLAFAALAFAIGVVAGLRALTAPMVVSWAAWLKWLAVQHTWAAFLGSRATPFVLTALAIGELITDQLPTTPSRKAPGSFFFRIVTGAFSGAAIGVGAGQSTLAGLVFGALGAVAGTLAGYDARTGLVKSLKVPDAAIAVPEDLIAVAGGFLLVSLVPH